VTMGAAGAAEPDAYLVERVREALAHDPRIAELGVCVRVSGERVIVTGDVATPERKAAVSEVVRPLIGGRTLENGLTVTSFAITDSEEQLG
jgi:osmotically-inducible protein OsmY